MKVYIENNKFYLNDNDNIIELTKINKDSRGGEWLHLPENSCNREWVSLNKLRKNQVIDYGNEVKEKKTLMKGGIYQGEAEKINRFNKLEKFLNSIKIREIDYDDQELFHEVGKKTNTPAVHKMTCNVELLNLLDNLENSS